MGRFTLLKSITGVGASTIELESLSLFKSDVNTINPDVIPSHITGKSENLKLPTL
ncbi:hypothetical protein [Daejeonella sp.]|uniref:hypothetical protein n=1 Tax=Daejeonella sp. TaxID=2805397 RepID=UPI002730828B|nr:hypothetical protein [Daejeonella sp.]MDP2414711.1 hypothetical protein [Daejeonella sp.]